MVRIRMTDKGKNQSIKLGQQVSRRDFVKVVGGVGGLLLLSNGACFGLRLLPEDESSSTSSDENSTAALQVEGSFGEVVSVSPLSALTPGNVYNIPEGNFFIVRLDDGGLLALYEICTHLGCNVPWDEQNQQFECPCHGSVFSREGAVISEPAPRPLDRFPITIENNVVRVDTASRVRRDGVSEEDIVYP